MAEAFATKVQPVLRKGSTGPSVKTLQQKLNALGGYGLAVDGSFGAKTDAAVRSYQAGVGIAIDGVVGNKTWSKLESNAKPTVLRQGASGADVKFMQQRLAAHGFRCGASGEDGKFGSCTLASVKAFQKAKGLTVDGVCGPKTWAALGTATRNPEREPEKTVDFDRDRGKPAFGV